MKYEVVKVRLEGVPQIPYADGVGKHRGVCMHATANWGMGEKEDLAMNERNWEQNHFDDAFVHYFCDYLMTLDVADDDYISYGCGMGNPYFINIELCQTKVRDRFLASYRRWVFQAAKVLYDNKLGVIDGVTLVSHKWVSDNMGGTHQDPMEYLAYHGYTWADVVRDVTADYAELKKGKGADEKMELSEYQWGQLGRALDGFYRQGKISDYEWSKKAYAGKLSTGDVSFLSLIIGARNLGIEC